MSKRKLRRATPVDTLMEQVEESLLKIGVIRTLVYHIVYQKELLRVWVRTSLGSGQVEAKVEAKVRSKIFDEELSAARARFARAEAELEGRIERLATEKFLAVLKQAKETGLL